MFKNAKINLLIALLFSFGANAADLTTDKIEVISQTPLPSIGVSINQLPSNVQTVKASDLKKSQSLDISSYINENLSGVNINENQSNPLQPDISYRGFTASPLLGTPQGLSVYVDGVRVNQPFGDVVSWDLIPKNAISNMQLYSGSNPMFGLNTLGGALSIQTKDGRNSPGGAIQLTGGSWGRKIGEFEYGGVSKDNSVDYFIAGTWFDEDGWRERSPSENKQLFGKLGWTNEKTSIHLTYAVSDSDLTGNGAAPESQLKRNYESVYTYPDNTKNKSHFANLDWSHYFNKDTVFSGNTYFRHIKTKTYNGDVNDTAIGETVLTSAGYTLAKQQTQCLGATSATKISGDREAGEKCNGLINRTDTTQKNAGIFGQISHSHEIFNRPNTYVLGGGFDWSQIDFNQSAEFASLGLNGEVVGNGNYANADFGANLNHSLDDRSAILKGKNHTWSIFGSDTFTAANDLNFTLSGRYNYSVIDNKDQQTHYKLGCRYVGCGTSGTSNGTYNLIDTTRLNSDADLSGRHVFHRFNPAVGMTYDFTKSFNLFAGYNEGSRAPTSIELGCANPNRGCNLPNAMAGDPSLNQVVSKTFEIGLRGNNSDLKWTAVVFNTQNTDDIQFVANTTSGLGYFKNFGKTQRRGFEGSLAKKFDKLSLRGNFTFLDATYQSPEAILSENNNSGIETTVDVPSERGYPYTGASGEEINTIYIKKGDKMPGIPESTLKLFADYDVNDKFNLGLSTYTVTSQYKRGDENNQDSRGKLAGYTTLNIHSAYKLHSEWTLFAKVNNVFDKQYATSGILGANVFGSDGVPTVGGVSGVTQTSLSETFVSPGAPRAAWVGIRYEFGGKKSSGDQDKD